MTLRGSRPCWITPGDDVALAAGELAEDLLVLEVAQPLDDDLARGRGRDPAETLRGVVELGAGHALLVQLVRPHHDVAALGVELDPGVLVGAVGAVVRDQQGLLDRRDEDGQGDVLLPHEGPQRGQVDVHVSPPLRRAPSLPRARPGVAWAPRPSARLNSSCTDALTRSFQASSRGPWLVSTVTASGVAAMIRQRRLDPSARPQLDQPADVAPEVPGQGQRPVDPGRGDLERVRRAVQGVGRTGQAVQPLADDPRGVGHLVQAQPLDRYVGCGRLGARWSGVRVPVDQDLEDQPLARRHQPEVLQDEPIPGQQGE